MATGTDAGGLWNTNAGNKPVTATPAVGDLIVVVHGMSGWASGDDSTITDNNSDGLGTYTKYGTSTAPLSTGGGTAGALWISVRNSPIGSASSTIFTATNTGDTGGGLTVLRFSGFSRFGSSAVKQTIGESSATENPPTITFGATTLTGNPVVLAVLGEDNPAAVTPPTGFTEADDTGWASPTTGIEVCWDDSGNTATLFSWSGGALTDHNEVGIELDASGWSITTGLGALTFTGYAPTATLPPAGGFRSLAVPWVYGFGKAAGDLGITTGLGQLVFTGYAPTLNLNISTGLGALTITGLAPTLGSGINTGLGQLSIAGFAPGVSATENKFASPGLGQLVLTGLQPSVNATDNHVASPGLGQLVLAGFAPSVGLTENIFVSTGLGELTLTGYAPQVGDNPNIQTGLGSLVIDGKTPTVSLTVDNGFRAWPFLGPYGFGSAPGYIYPDAGNLVITGYAPTVVSPLNISTGLGQLAFTGYAPALNVGGNTTIQTGLGELVFTGYMPIQTLTLPAPQPGNLVITGYAPTVSSSAGSLSITTGLGQLVISGFAPDLRIPVQISSGLGSLAITGYAPTVNVSETISTGLGQLVLTGFAPSLSATEHIFITTGLGNLDFNGLAPNVSATDHKWADAALANLLISCFAPGIQIGTGPEITTGLGELVITSFSPTVTGGEAYLPPTGGGYPGKRRKPVKKAIDEFIEEPLPPLEPVQAVVPRPMPKAVIIPEYHPPIEALDVSVLTAPEETSDEEEEETIRVLLTLGLL